MACGAHPGASEARRADAGDGIDWREGEPLPADRPRELATLVQRCRALHGARPVLDDHGRAASWDDLDAWSGRLAGNLAGRLPPGGRLAILSPNSLDHLIAELAAWRLGAIAVPLFTSAGPLRLARMLAATAPQVALLDDPAHRVHLPADCLALAPEDLRRLAAQPAPAVERAVGPDTPCLILFTSGSSGAPRGVTLSHDNLCSQQAAFAGLWPEVGGDDRLAAYLPWHHSFGALAERLWALVRGAHVTLVPGGGRDREALLRTVRAVRPTVFMSVPKVHRLLAGGEHLDRRCLRWAFSAGAPLPADIAAWYARHGLRLVEGWGLTETSPSATITRRAPLPGVVGVPIPGVAVGVRRGDGRILVRGPNRMLGYWRDPAATAACLVGEAIDSGDLGAWTPDGLRLDGRADALLKLGNGEKVAAAELEAGLQAGPEIAHAVVCAEPDLVALVEPAADAAPAQVAARIAALNARQEVPWQRIGACVLITRPLCVESGLLTGSLKVARGPVIDAYRRWLATGEGPFRGLPPG